MVLTSRSQFANCEPFGLLRRKRLAGIFVYPAVDRRKHEKSAGLSSGAWCFMSYGVVAPRPYAIAS